MNKLLEILDELNIVLDSCSPINDTSEFRLLLSDKIIEYARSIINIESNPLIELPLSDYIRLESAWDKKHKEMLDRIDQDLQSLKK